MRPTRSTCSLSAEFSLVRETILTQHERITQLYIIQSEDNPFNWFGVLFVDSGIYAGAVIRFVVLIDESYPDCACPRVIFDPIPFHPLVNPATGQLDTRNAFPDWNSNTHKIHQLLLFVKRVITNAEMYIRGIQELLRQDSASTISKGHQESASRSQPNDGLTQETLAFSNYSLKLTDLFDDFSHTLECIRLYELSKPDFQLRIDDFKRSCCQQLFYRPGIYGNDRNALLFSPWNPDVHEPVRKCILEGRFAPTSLFASYHKETDSVSFIPGSDSA